MRYRSYHKEIQLATAQILDVLNDIVIDRRDANDNIQQLISVPCLYGSRSRILKSLENKEKNIKLPLLVLSINSINRDSSRVHSIHDGLLYQDGSANYNYLKNTPVPINIEYNVDIITKFQEDMDMILGNFIPFFNPDVYVVIPHPINAGQNLKPQIVSNGNINLTFPDEISANESSRIIASTMFTFKTWIFPGMSSDSEGKVIKRINFNPSIGYDSDNVGRLQGWFCVPKYDWETKGEYSFSKFTQNILCGYIDSRYTDQLQLSAGISGYWSDISAMVTGNTLGIQMSGNPTYLTTDEGSLLFITDHSYLPKNLAYLSIEDYVDYYTSCISGQLSGYNGVQEPYIS